MRNDETNAEVTDVTVQEPANDLLGGNETQGGDNTEDVPTETNEDIVEETIGGEPDEDELVVPELFEEGEEEEHLTQPEQDGELGFTINEDGLRKSSRLARRWETSGSSRNYRMSVRESIQRLGQVAHDALKKEFGNMADLDVFEPIRYEDLDADQRKKVIQSSAFLGEKTDENGRVTSVKARFVGSGNMMDRDLYESGSSPTVTTEGVFMQIALCAGSRQRWCTVDIGSAYLHSEMDEFVAVYIAPGLVRYVVETNPAAAEFVDNKGRLLVRLKKALYGCIQSSRLWYELMDKTLKEAGFRANGYDSCMYHKGLVGSQTTVCLHVDDLFISSDDQGMIDELIEFMRSKFREVKVKDGPINLYLGMRISEKEDCFEVDMQNYIEECLSWSKTSGMAVTPATADLFDVIDGDPVLPEEEQEDFHTGVAKLLYLAKRSRPDILVAISFLSSRVNKATAKDTGKLRRVFQYLRHTVEKTMRFIKGARNPEIVAYVDAGYGIHTEGESRSGLVVTVNGTPVIWKTNKQAIVTKSSTEAELVALSDACTDILWARQLLIDQGYEIGEVCVGEDNQSVLAMIEKRRYVNARTRHINIRYFFIVDRIKSGELKMVYVPTDMMLADFMTKPLTGKQFSLLQGRLLGSPATSSDEDTKGV